MALSSLTKPYVCNGFCIPETFTIYPLKYENFSSIHTFFFLILILMQTYNIIIILKLIDGNVRRYI